MGIIPCTSTKDKNEILNLIEKSFNNKKTTLDKKIYEEYYILKDLIKPQKKQEKNNNKEKEKENFPIITNKNNFISIKKRLDRFIKWYFMSHPNQYPNTKQKRNSTSETKFNLYNKEIDFNLENIDNIPIVNNLNQKLKKNPSDGNLKNSINKNNFNIGLISYNNNCYTNNFQINNEQNYFNQTKRIKQINNNNEISPIIYNKKNQFILETEKNSQNFKQDSNIIVNLNNKFDNFPNNSGIYQQCINSNQNNNFKFSTKLSSKMTIPNINKNINSTSLSNINYNNIHNRNSINKIKL